MQEQDTPSIPQPVAGQPAGTTAPESPASEPQAPAMYQSLIPPEQPVDEAGDEADFFLAERPSRRRFFDDPDFAI